MNQAQDNQNPSGSMDTFAEEFKRVVERGARTPEENRRRKAEIDFASMKNRADARIRYHEELKKATMRRLQMEKSI